MLRGGLHLNAIFPPLDMVLMEYLVHVSSNPKTVYHHPGICVVGCFVNFWVIFWVYLGGVVFLKGLVKLREIRNTEDLQQFKIRISSY